MKPVKVIRLACIALISLTFMGCGKNTTYTVELEGNPDTEYTWTCQMQPEGIVKEKSQNFKPFEKKDKGGQAGIYSFTFEGVAPGEVVLHFEYNRSWELEKPPVQHKDIALKVDKKNRISELKKEDKN